MESSALTARPSTIERAVPLGIAALGVIQVLTAAWIVVAPHSFFDSVAPFGAYNSHFLGDVAAFQGGVGVALLVSLAVPALRAGALAAVLGMNGFHMISHWIDVNDAHPGSNADVFDAISVTLLFLFNAALMRAAVQKESP
jgi:hypothetical protein